jgi:hypothetical protein
MVEYKAFGSPAPARDAPMHIRIEIERLRRAGLPVDAYEELHSAINEFLATGTADEALLRFVKCAVKQILTRL